MKKIFATIALLAAMTTASAQDDMYGTVKQKEAPATETPIPLTEGGAYERQEVVNVDGASAAVLFERAMIALSDWTGSDGNARIGIDYQNSETHTVIYKGHYSLGFKDVFMGNGWKRQADCTLKVRCKDGRAQVTLTVPTITMTYSSNNVTRQGTVEQLLKEVQKAKGDKRKRGDALVAYLQAEADAIVKAMADRLADNTEDDF